MELSGARRKSFGKRQAGRVPLHPELLLLFYSETSLMLAHSAGKGNGQAVKQAKHVGVTSEGSSFLLLKEMAWVNHSEH